MTDILNQLLTLVLIYGYPIIAGIIILGYLGLPISLNAILLAAGAFASDGTLNIYILVPFVTIVALGGDIFNYILGRKFGFLLINTYTERVGLTKSTLSSVDLYLSKWGGWIIFITRFLLTPIGIPVNIISGVSHYPLKKFILFAGIGEFIWAYCYIMLGFILGANWVTLWSYISETPQILLLGIVGIGLFIMSIRMWHKRS